MPEHYDYECATCGMMASEHISVTSMCKVLRAVSNRESSLLVERDKLKRELTEAREQRDRLATIARELTAMIRVNVMWGRFAECSVEQVDEHLKPWNEKIAAVKGGSHE
jgi:hypothetical protein